MNLSSYESGLRCIGSYVVDLSPMYVVMYEVSRICECVCPHARNYTDVRMYVRVLRA